MKYGINALLSVMALSLLLVASPVMASEVDVMGTNEKTGADSDNDNKYDVDNDYDADANNTGITTNAATAAVTTGENEQIKNTTGGDIESGAVDASTDWKSMLNNGSALLGASNGDLTIDGDFTNDTTGADSDNLNKLDVDNDIDLALNNLADVWNGIDFAANTGDNLQKKNTMAGDIDTGDIGLDSMIENIANSDSGLASAASGSVEVDVEGENHKTGADSDNDNKFIINNKVNHVVANTALFTNGIAVTGNTGGNKQTKNTMAGDLHTGDIDVETDIVNEANNGTGFSGSHASDLDVNGDFVNDTTGADSKNLNRLDVDNDVDTTVSNVAVVENLLSVDANTGDNKQDKNTESGDIKTGSVSIDFTTSTEVNSN